MDNKEISKKKNKKTKHKKTKKNKKQMILMNSLMTSKNIFTFTIEEKKRGRARGNELRKLLYT